MYEATKSERELLIQKHDYNPEAIDLLDIESEKVRRGISIDLCDAISVCHYQSDLQEIRKSQKRWWQLWKYVL